jgi:hypothetical protein
MLTYLAFSRSLAMEISFDLGLSVLA